MATVYTKPRRITVDQIRQGDEVLVWKNGGLCTLWRAGSVYEDDTEWHSVDRVDPENPDVPLGKQIITFWGGGKRPVGPDHFVMIREGVQVPEDVLCTTCG
jgi:hypothetical protein